MIFDKPGKENTNETLRLALEEGKAKGINTFVIATNTGETLDSFIECISNSPYDLAQMNIVAVTHVTGFREEDVQEMSDEKRLSLEKMGISVVTGAHSLGGIGRAVRNKLETFQVDEIIAYTLRLFGQGTKVAVEIAMMAADAGKVSCKERIVSIGGSGRGADTGLILKPANTHKFFDIKIDSIICKPKF